MKLSALLRDFKPHIGGFYEDELDLIEIKQITTKVHEASEETLFVCAEKGLRDGHYNAHAAYSKGCRAFLVERELSLPSDAVVLLCENSEVTGAALAARLLDHPAQTLSVYGVFGKLGKTTVCAALAQILEANGKRAAAILTEGVLWDGKLHRFSNTVPDGVELQYLLRQLCNQGVRHVALEISAHMLACKGADVIPFAALLITDAADEPAPDPAQLQEICGEAPLIVPFRYRDAFAHRQIFTYGMGGDCAAESCAPFFSKKGFGTRFVISLAGESECVSLPVPGDFAVQNALAVTLLAYVAGCSVGESARMLSRGVMWGCLQCVTVVGGRYIYRDAAYSPEMLTHAIGALRDRTAGKLTVVIGSVGGRAFERRAALGRAASCADLVYLTADNPDDESPLKICEEMAAGMDEPWRYVLIPDREAAVQRAVWELRPGDVLLVAGKSREDYQLLGGKRVPFDEERLIKRIAKQF